MTLLYGRVPNDWGYMQGGAHLLFSRLPDGGLHLYASHAEVQMGPLTLALARLADVAAGTRALLVLTVLGCLLLVPTLRFAELAATRLRAGQPVRPVTLLVGFVIATALWVEMPLFGHLDDCLVLLPLMAAVWAVASGRPLLAAALVGAACAGKPWGLVGVPLLLAPSPGGSRVRAVALAGCIVALVYSPFLLADHHTLTAGKPTLLVDRLSSLQLLGIHEGTHPWGGLRAVQLGLAVCLGVLACARRRWSAVLLLGVAARLLLDPGSNPYFPAGLAAAAVLFDLAGRRRLPWASLITLVVWMPWFASISDRWGTMIRTSALLALIGLPWLRAHADGRAGIAAVALHQPVLTAGTAAASKAV